MDPNDPNVGPIFVNDDGQACLNYGGAATNCSINLASFPSMSPDAYMPYTLQYNLLVQHDVGHRWAIEGGYVGTRYVGGLGFWDPFLAPLASPSNPITVTDLSGNSYAMTANTVNNEELRHRVVGLSRKRGSRYSANFAQANYNSLQLTAMRRMHRGLYFQAAYTFSKNIDNVSGAQSTDELNAFRNGQGGASILNFQNDPRQNRATEQALQQAMEEVSQLKNKLEEENIYLREEINLVHNFDEIVGRSDATKYVLFKIEQVAPTDSTVLITGETGTGKELVARAIHRSSLRQERPLVRVNCAALSPSLIESELFGHEKGAFTGATARKLGRFELADNATIFLDEIGELPLELQSKLLRVIQEGEFERLGSSKTIKVDARVIAATNRDLKVAVEEGVFREDLWYRLNVFPITVPPLRERSEDVPVLVEHFVRRFSQKVGKQISSIAPVSLRVMQDYAWPGNVRELANVIERAVINTTGNVLRIVDHFEKPQVGEQSHLDKTLEEVEKEYILRILNNTNWRINGHRGAAKILGMNPSTLRTRMTKLGIQKVERKTADSAV